MKVFLLFVLAIVATVSAVPLPDDDDDVKGWFVPTVDGKFDWVSRKQYEQDSRLLIPKPFAVKYYLYTNASPKTGKQVIINDAISLAAANFNKDIPTRILIHGWLSTQNSFDNVKVRNALLSTGSYNVFSVDWSSKAFDVNYITARNSVSKVGQNVASFIDFLNSEGMSYSDLTVIGHSLGAHVAGFAGKNNSNLQVIIGLDPAFPLFLYSNCAGRLCDTDATFVETIQTDGGKLGFLKPIGNAAFYPNGGKVQPGCQLDLTGVCSHMKSWLYYAQSILQTNEFPSMKCSTYSAAIEKNCGGAYSNVMMGAPGSYGTSGTYYVPVTKNSPYGMG